MAHHLTETGDFQSDNHPDLPVNRIRINLESPLSIRALMVLSADYEDSDVEFASDIRRALAKNHPEAYLAGTFCRVMDSNGHFYGQPGLILHVEVKQEVEESMVLRILCHVATPRGTRKIDAQSLLPGLHGWSPELLPADPEDPEAAPQYRPLRLRLPIQTHPLTENEDGKHMGELQSGFGSFEALGDDETLAIKGVLQQVIAKIPGGLPEGVDLTA